MAKKVEAIGYYYGYSIKSNYTVEVKFRFPQTSLQDSIRFLPYIGQQFPLVLELDGEETKFDVGVVSIHKVVIDRDGEATISFRSAMENSKFDNLSLMLKEEALFKISVGV